MSEAAAKPFAVPLTRVLLADDHEIVRKGLRTVLADRPEWEICGEATTGREVVRMCVELRPDVVVLDIGMPELNGLEAARQILKNAPETQILILTVYESETLIREVIEAGARGYVLKSDASRDLIAAIDALRFGGRFFTSSIPQTLLDAHLPGKGSTSRTARNRLTPREREVVQLLAEGNSNKDVANKLNISVKTAETHRTNIMRKLDLHSISELVRYAARNKIIEVGI